MRIKRLATFIIGFVVAMTVGINNWLTTPSNTPEMAIKKYVFSKGSVHEAFQLQITPKNYKDPDYGWQYWVEGYYDDPGPVKIPFFYLKKDDRGWYVTSAGTGP